MPRTYSKAGCITCKRRKRKCDESKPICISCARFNLSCSYEACPSVRTRRTAPISFGPFEVQQHPSTTLGAWPHKSWDTQVTTSCFRCVERQVKCDEETPTCIQCNRANLVCAHPSKVQVGQSTGHAATRTPSPLPRMYVARVSGQTEVLAFEYFDLNTLPMFRICQPSILWDVTVGFSVQTNDTLRHIAIAIGFHQRLAEGFMNDTPTPYMPSDYQAEVFYGRAVRAVQGLADTALEVEGPAVALCCLLMVALECLRDCPKSLLLHLRSAVRIVVHMAQRGKQMRIDETIDVIALLQQSCISAWLYCTSPSCTGDYALILQEVDFYQLVDLTSPLQRSSTMSLEVHNIISQTLHTLRQLMHPLLQPKDRMPLFDQLYRWRAKTVDIRNTLVSQEDGTANHGFLEAKLLMTEAFLSAMLDHPKDNESERRKFWHVLELIQTSLRKLNSTRLANLGDIGPHPFAMSTASIHMLESVIRAGHGGMLEERAIDLLKSCPVREGLWNTEWILQAHYARRSQVSQDALPTKTLAIEPDDHLASWEDCVDIAQEMLERVDLSDGN